jgi:hypothetical protein
MRFGIEGRSILEHSMPIAKLLGISALAAATTLSVAVPTTAGAHDRYDRYGRYDHRYERHYGGRYDRVRYDRHRHYRPHKVRVCRPEWRHHHRERVCYYTWR